MGVEVFRKEAMSFDGRTVLPRGLSRKFAHQVMNGNDIFDSVCIGAAEDKRVIHISFDSPDECHGDAIWRCAGIAGLKAVEAVSYVFMLFADPFYIRVKKRPSRHMNRALDDCHIFLFCLDVHLFKFVRRIAFFRGYETCCHLHAGKTERKIMSDIFFIKNTGKLSLSIKEASDLMAKEVEEETFELPESGEEATTSLGSLFANIKLD